MARSRGVVCTAGFESVSEAMWLGKPTYMIPTPGHLEQRTNALDADRTGAGIYSRRFDLDDFMSYLDVQSPGERAATQQRFQAWIQGSEARFVEEIEAAAHPRPALARVTQPAEAREAA
jgi:UDP-N-acetylglucosamine:LPS N-acetylglucosamine transferase